MGLGSGGWVLRYWVQGFGYKVGGMEPYNNSYTIQGTVSTHKEWVNIYISMSACMQGCMYVCMYVCMQAGMYVCNKVLVYRYVRMISVGVDRYMHIYILFGAQRLNVWIPAHLGFMHERA